jgi:flagellar hook-basal body complex protein FliE
MVNLNANVSSIVPSADKATLQVGKTITERADFTKAAKAIGQFISEVDDIQHSSDMSIKDLLTGKNNDIASVVSAVAKADMSFKLLVGVRNKLIEAYKQTVNMQL